MSSYPESTGTSPFFSITLIVMLVDSPRAGRIEPDGRGVRLAGIVAEVRVRFCGKVYRLNGNRARLSRANRLSR
ncbi:hypothetical protein [Nocardia wallacei]|uniref:hypothetical protein n=1 Tax=Nocardia wallacei TaxID=480035 RepID=UPI0024542CEB|nr:hypothetical protein [Nocardia wallacei]